jgi:TRAP-type mannitol/chloroaromatic compound transport system permease small subunit
MEIFKKYIKAVDSISEWTGRIFSWSIVLLVLITVFEVISRRFLNSPSIWSFDISKQLYSLHFMIAASYALLHGSHVAVDIVYNYLSQRKKAFLDVFCYLIFFFPFNSVMLWKGFEYAKRSWMMHEVTRGVLNFPVYPIKTIIPITALLLLLQGLAIFIQRCYAALNKEIVL